MKLEELLGEDLYKQVAAKIDEANAKEPDKLKHIKYADLSEGNYVGKSKYDAELEKLNNMLSGKDKEIATANELIKELKKGTKDDTDMQTKISGYEQQVAALQKELQETRIKSAIKVALHQEKAKDIDYLTFKLEEKLREKKETLELDENGNIKGWSNRIADLKTQCPDFFDSDGGKKPLESKLPTGDGSKAEPTSLADAIRQQYEQA